MGLLAAIIAAQWPAAFAQSRLIDELEQAIPLWLARYEVPGVSIALIENDRLVWSRGFGIADLESGRPMTDATICRTGPVSESLTAWGVMKLVEQGRVQLDAPISRYLKRWQLPPSQFDHSEVTVRRLLSHCAGIMQQYYPHRSEPGERPETKALLSGIAIDASPAHVTYAPGSDFRFSQANYTLLELLIEELSGEDFAVFMQREVLYPLGMADSNYDWSETPPRKRAAPHDSRQQALPVTFVDHRAAGGLNSTAYDLAAFLTAALPSLRNAVQGSPVLNQGSINLMERPASLPEDAHWPASEGRRYGLGYLIEQTGKGRIVFSNGGPTPDGWYASFYGIPETATGMVLLTNSRNGGALANSIKLLWAESTGVDQLPSIAAIRKNRRLSWLFLAVGSTTTLGLIGYFLYYLLKRQRSLARDRWKQKLPLIALLGFLLLLIWTTGRQWLLTWSPLLYPWGAAVATLLCGVSILELVFPRYKASEAEKAE